MELATAMGPGAMRAGFLSRVTRHDVAYGTPLNAHVAKLNTPLLSPYKKASIQPMPYRSDGGHL